MMIPWTASEPPYIIAEIGVNHDGSARKALDLVDAAASAGASAVKLQLFETDLLMSRAARLAAYQAGAGEQDPFSMLRRLELSIDDMAPIVQRAKSLGLDAIVTVFSVELVEIAEQLNWAAYKSASPDIIHRPLLEAMAATGKPLIISTGAATMDESRRAVDWLRPAHDRLAVLQCVSSYPTPDDQCALGGMLALRDAFDGALGYSDHTASTNTGALAVQLGAAILEKHLTYDRRATGPDHAASLDPAMFRTYVDKARAAARVPVGAGVATAWDAADPRIGPIEKRVLDIERDVREASRQSIVARRRIQAGERIQVADLTFKRPGVGLPPHAMERVIGRCAARVIETDAPLVDDDLA